MPRVIFDTDIGTDVDDILALGFLLGEPGVTLEGVTTVYGDVNLRARMVLKLLQLRGLDGVPVCTGVANPLLGLDPIYWPGHEGVGLLQPDDVLPPSSGQHAVDFLIQRVMSEPGEITVLAVGPLTNIAVAITREPRFAKSVKNLVIMGGNVDARPFAGGIAEHNIKCDPEAAQIVFRSGAPISLVPLDVTLKTIIRQVDADRIAAVGTPYHAALADQIIRYPPFSERGGQTFLHDPLAALALVEPGLLEWEELHVQIETRSSLTRAMTVALPAREERAATARVALRVDAEGAERAILERLMG